MYVYQFYLLNPKLFSLYTNSVFDADFKWTLEDNTACMKKIFVRR